MHGGRGLRRRSSGDRFGWRGDVRGHRRSSVRRQVERFHRTLLEEWAYVRPYASETERIAAYADFLHIYNHHRGHTALGGQSPADRVSNLAGHNT